MNYLHTIITIMLLLIILEGRNISDEALKVEYDELISLLEIKGHDSFHLAKAKIASDRNGSSEENGERIL